MTEDARSRPEAVTYLAELDSAGQLDTENSRLKAYCARCSTRLGFVCDTAHGRLWVGLLGSHRDGRQTRQDAFRRAGARSDGRVIVPQWIEPWRTWYMCDCKCPRNSADAPTIHAALLAGRRKVEVPPQRDTPE